MHRRAPKKKTPSFYLAADSEWDRGRPDPWLSTQFACESGAVVFMTPDVRAPVRGRLERAAGESGVRLVFRHRDDGTNLLGQALDLLGVDVPVVRLLLFYSPKDVEHAVGWDRFRPAIDKGNVRQRNGLSGKLQAGRTVILKDLSGWAGKTSLLTFATSLGLPCEDKGAMDACKACMYQGLCGRPEDFLRYGVGDLRLLLGLLTAFVTHFRTLQHECRGMPEEGLWAADDIPMTSGALVARTFERWLHGQAGDRDVFRFALRKCGILGPDDRRYAQSLPAYLDVVERYRSAAAACSACLYCGRTSQAA